MCAMLLNILKAKNQQGQKVEFEQSLALDNDLISAKGGEFTCDATVKGYYLYEDEQLHLVANVSVGLLCVCDKCGEKFEKTLVFPVEETFVEQYDLHDSESYSIINGTSIKIDEVVTDNLLLSLPTKLLCKEDCKGLCQVCGKNKNYYTCHCEQIQQELERLDNPFDKLKNRR